MRLILDGEDNDYLDVYSHDSSNYVGVISNDIEISVSFDDKTILELRKYYGEYRMYSFKTLEEYHNFNFEEMEEAEIIWNNFTLDT